MQIVQVLQSAEGPVNEPERIPMQLKNTCGMHSQVLFVSQGFGVCMFDLCVELALIYQSKECNRHHWGVVVVFHC